MDMQVGPLLAALILSTVYAVEGRLLGEESSERFWLRRRWISAAAGVSVAYIFVDVLPELAAQQKVFVTATGHVGVLFAEGRIYMLALFAFVVMYGLDHMVLASKAGQRESATEESLPIYGIHLVGYATYSGLIGYLLVERADRGIVSLLAYTFAMALHFFVVGHSLSETHGRRYRARGRWLLVFSVLAGWLLGTVTNLSEMVFAHLFAVLAGGVVMTSLRDELPRDRQGRFWPFCAAALLFACILLWSEAASQRETGSLIHRGNEYDRLCALG
jgi:hypothetical protein